MPNSLLNAERATREQELKKYRYVISTIPYPGARVLGEGTEGKVMTAKEIAAIRKKFTAEIAAAPCLAPVNGK